MVWFFKFAVLCRTAVVGTKREKERDRGETLTECQPLVLSKPRHHQYAVQPSPYLVRSNVGFASSPCHSIPTFDNEAKTFGRPAQPLSRTFLAVGLCATQRVRYDEEKQKQKSGKGKGKAAAASGTTGATSGTSGGGGSGTPDPEVEAPPPASAKAATAPPEAGREGPPGPEAATPSPTLFPTGTDNSSGVESSAAREDGRSAEDRADGAQDGRADGDGGGVEADGVGDDEAGSDEGTDTDDATETELDEGEGAGADAEEGLGAGAKPGGGSGQVDRKEEEEEGGEEAGGVAGDQKAAMQRLRSAALASGGVDCVAAMPGGGRSTAVPREAGGDGGGSSGAGDGRGGENGAAKPGSPPVEIATSSDESAETEGTFRATGSRWGAASATREPEDKKGDDEEVGGAHPKKTENGEVEAEVPGGKQDSVAGGSRGGTRGSRLGLPQGPVRRIRKRKAGEAAAPPPAGLEEEQQSAAGQGNDVEEVSLDGGRKQPRCSKPAPSAADGNGTGTGTGTSSHKSPRVPLQARGKNEEPLTPPQPSRSKSAVDGGGGREVVALTSAGTALSSSSLGEDESARAVEAGVADENALSPKTRRHERRQATNPAAQTTAAVAAADADADVACESSRDTPAGKQQARDPPPTEVHEVDGGSSDSSDDDIPVAGSRRAKGARTSRRGRAEAPADAPAAAAACAATTAAATETSTKTADKALKRRPRVGNGPVNAAVARRAVAAASSATATAFTSGLASDNAVSLVDDDDDDDDSAQAKGGAAAVANGAGGRRGSGRDRTDGGSDADGGGFEQTVGERNKQRQPRAAAAAAVSCRRPGSGGRGRELTSAMPSPIGKERGERGGGRRAAERGQTPSPQKRTRSASSPKVDLASGGDGVCKGGHDDDDDDVTVVEPSCNGKSGGAGAGTGTQAGATTTKSPAGKKNKAGGSEPASGPKTKPRRLSKLGEEDHDSEVSEDY